MRFCVYLPHNGLHLIINLSGSCPVGAHQPLLKEQYHFGDMLTCTPLMRTANIVDVLY